MSDGRSAGEVWQAEAKIVPADDTSIESTVSTEAFINKVGAHHVFKTGADRATVKYWEGQIAAGRKVSVTINYDSMGNIIGADGRHRAVAALRMGVKRVHVHVTRRK